MSRPSFSLPPILQPKKKRFVDAFSRIADRTIHRHLSNVVRRYPVEDPSRCRPSRHERLLKELASAKDEAALESIVNKAVGATGLMQFHLFNLGEVLRKELGPQAPKSIRLLIGNPYIMKEMVKHVPDAGSYAPVTILIDERADGVHLTYDTMTSYLKPYGNPAALQVARDLDTKIQSLLAEAAH